MKQKLKKLSLWSFLLALVIFSFAYIFFHFITPEGTFSLAWQAQSGKPFIAQLFGIWGVCFLFAAVMSRLIAHIFFPNKDDNKE